MIENILLPAGTFVLTSLLSLAIYLIKESKSDTDDRFNGVSSSIKTVQQQSLEIKIETLKTISESREVLLGEIGDLKAKIARLETLSEMSHDNFKEVIREAKEKKNENFGRVVVKD